MVDLTDPEERARAAYSLRLAGVPYHDIARQLGYANASGAWKAAKRVADAQTPNTEGNSSDDEEKALELARLDGMLTGLWPAARRGDVGSVLAVLRIQERRARYRGLDAAAGGVPATPTGEEEDEVDRARRRREERRARAASRRGTDT